MDRTRAGDVERAGTAAATEVRRDSTLGAGLDRDFDAVFAFLEVDLARDAGPLAAFFVALGFAFALVAIGLGNL
ncbi:MAG: hypothetical protein DMG11_04915 [Acidobacteria bacterium]|nr:MAG: hypothetical protein DMG11_04915 [Acidobacteriota bacterium]